MPKYVYIVFSGDIELSRFRKQGGKLFNPIKTDRIASANFLTTEQLKQSLN